MRNIILKSECRGVDWHSLAAVFERAPLGIRESEKLKRAFENSYSRCFAYYENHIIGAARALCDGEYYAAIYDVVVEPEYQGKGVGKQMMNFLIENLPVAQVLLVSVPGKEEFYRKLQFRKNKTAMTRYTNPDKQALADFIE